MVGYPTKKVYQAPINVNLGSRGMALEDAINESNAYYLAIDKAIIYKKPTPIQIVHVDYKSRATARIDEAYFRTPSTTDYNGIYRGKYIDFEAKQIQSKKSFPLQFIHKHQVEHLKKIVEHGGIGFVLLQFSSYQETYLIDAKDVINKYEDSSCKSLSYVWVKEVGHLVKQRIRPLLDYLEVVDKVYFEGE